LLKYFLKKILLMIPLLFGVVTLVFCLVELAPGNAADKFFTPETPPEVREMIVAKYGLDKPTIVRYGLLLRNLAVFDFGESMAQERPVFDIIMDALPNTVILSAVTLIVLYPLGIFLGTIQAVKHRTMTDTGISVGSLFFYAMPSFWLALMLQLLVAFYWGDWIKDLAAEGILSAAVADFLILPTAGMYNAVTYDYMSGFEQCIDRARHLILPGVAMGMTACAGTARYMRSSLLEVIRQDYVRTARAKGLHERTVIMKHAMRNAMLPIVTLIGMSIPRLFSGAVLVETIFAWPGMGRLIVSSIYTQDTPLIIACFFVFAVLVLLGNLIADMLYAVVDPRIKYD
jgi:peptide/nickel transport system permease protein